MCADADRIDADRAGQWCHWRHGFELLRFLRRQFVIAMIAQALTSQTHHIQKDVDLILLEFDINDTG